MGCSNTLQCRSIDNALKSDKRKIKVFETQKRKLKISWVDKVRNGDLQIRMDGTKSIWKKQLEKGEKSVTKQDPRTTMTFEGKIKENVRRGNGKKQFMK